MLTMSSSNHLYHYQTVTYCPTGLHLMSHHSDGPHRATTIHICARGSDLDMRYVPSALPVERDHMGAR